MKNRFHLISILKSVDVGIQVLAFMVLLLLLPGWGAFALFVEAGVQVVSCIAWSLYFSGSIPRFRPGSRIRRVFLFILSLWLLSCAWSNTASMMLYVMLLAGPVMGIVYFIVTVRERAFYKNARKPYYLL